MTDAELRKHFIESLYSTLDGVVSPTPYMQITEEGRVDVQFLNGRGTLPRENSTEVTILDIDVASLFFDDFNILFEGETGVGKTYTSDALFSAVFGTDGHYTLRLGGGLLGASALEPFTATTMEGGVPKTKIDHDKCQRFGALFIDEINRGDSQEVFQVVDGKIHVNGDTGYLRLPIPSTDRYKKLAIIAAMNPADAQHSSALELDIAGENRFLKFQYPNGIEEAASSQLDKKEEEHLHQAFWEAFQARTGLEGSWRELYPLVTDPTKVDTSLDGAAREFIDVAIGYVGKDPLATFQRNRELMKAAGYIAKSIVTESNDLERVREAQKSMKHGFVRRDLRKIHDLAGLLGFIKSMKDGSYTPRTSLNDVAASLGIVLEAKRITGAEEGNLMALVNDALHSYRELRAGVNVPESFGARQAVWQAAVYAGQEGGVDAYQSTVQRNIGKLNTQTSGVAGSTIRSRLVGDLVVLDHFSEQHKTAVEEALKGDAPFEALKQVYAENKGKSAVYEHRLSSVIR